MTMRPAAAAAAADTSRQLKRPNILLMVVEDLGPRIGAYGDTLAHTPNIDKLAHEGVMFTQAFTAAGVCSPSRAALIMGLHPETFGAQHMRVSSFGEIRIPPGNAALSVGIPYEAVPPAYAKAFPELLRAAGYETLNKGKTDYQIGNPFSIWDISGDDVSLDDWSGEKPFFLMMSDNNTHESRLFRPETTLYTPRIVDRVAGYMGRFKDGFPFSDPLDVTVPGYLPDTPRVRRDLARQYDNIRLLDNWVGTVISDLARRSLLDSTVIIFTTDHGDGFPRAKRTVYDSGLHVPFIVRFPKGQAAGTVRHDLISFVDLAPSLLSLGRAPLPSYLQGRDVLTSDRGLARTHIFAARGRIDEYPDRVRAVRDSRYKYVRNEIPGRPQLAPVSYRENTLIMQSLRDEHSAGRLRPAFSAYFSKDRPLEELYDIYTDPHETNNLADHPQFGHVKTRLARALQDHRQQTGDLAPLSETEMVLDHMWPKGEQPKTLAPLVRINDAKKGKREITVSSLTGGASIGYRFCEAQGCDDDARYHLYTQPVIVPPHAVTIESKAIRYGFAESGVVVRSLE